MIEGIVGIVVQIMAVLVYRDFRREGEPSGLKRAAAFILGFPWTFLVMAVVDFRPRRVSAGDDELELLEEIRRERKPLDGESGEADG